MRKIIFVVTALAPFVSYVVGLRYGYRFGHARGTIETLDMVTKDLNNLAEKAELIINDSKRSEQVLYS